MITHVIGKDKGETITFMQAESMDEAKKAGFPGGVSFCWEKGGKRFFSPYDIIGMVQQNIAHGTFEIEKEIAEGNVEDYYDKLINAQYAAIDKTFDSAKERCRELGLPEASIRNIDEMKNAYKRVGVPDKDGEYRPTVKQAKSAVPGIDAMYNEAMLDDIAKRRTSG